MSLRSLIVLVLAVIAGTAISVRWYLGADAAVAAARQEATEAPFGGHEPIWMRAEPARGQQDRPAYARPGVARWDGSRAPEAARAGLFEVQVQAILRRSTVDPEGTTHEPGTLRN